jgi:hypothetical protein
MARYRGLRPPDMRRRPKRKSDRPCMRWEDSLFAGSPIRFGLTEELESFESCDSSPGEDADSNDGDDEADQGAASPLAPQSSPKVDRLRSESGKIVLDGENDVLRRLRDVSERCREPERYYLGVLVFPKKADGRVRVFADQMVPTTNGPPETPANPHPAAPPRLKPPRRLRPRSREA